MGSFKFAKNMFIEVEELNRLKKFLINDGYQLDFENGHETLGIVRNQYYDPNFSYFQVLNVNIPDNVYVSPGFAYDRNRNVLTSTGASLLIPQRNTYYWLKASYKTNNIETGTVTIGGSTGGLMTGTGTVFTAVLRGQPNFPSKISFLNSVNYPGQYTVLEVDADGVAYLQGSFPVKETNLQYAVVGTFTPGTYPPTTDQYPFLYDNFNYTFVPESGVDVTPAYQDGLEFFLARVISTNLGVQVQDRRGRFICKTRTERLFSELPAKVNPLIGIEGMIKTALRNKVLYTVSINWGFRVTTESRNYNTNTTTITSGSGGIYATANAFTTGDFDGWRYYYQNGDWSRVVSSVKNGAGIDLHLDTLKSESFGVMVCPNAEEIEINLIYFVASTTGAGQQYAIKRQRFYIFTQNPTLLINQDDLDNNFLEVDLQYRFKTVLNLTDYANFNLSPYTIPGLSQVVSRNILLTVNNVNPAPVTAWRGLSSSVYCVLDTLPTPIYYKIVTQNQIVKPTVYFPNSSFPQSSVDETTLDIYVQFFSDIGLNTPMNVTHPNLRVVVKQENTVTNTVYDVPAIGSQQVSNLVTDGLLIYTINPAGVNNMFLATVDLSNKTYQHQTNQIGTRRITNDTESTYNVFPSVTLTVGNTGYKGYTTLEEYYTATGLPDGNTKPNTSSDPNYVAPIQDLTNCPLAPPNIEIDYGYSLNVLELVLTGPTTGSIAAPVIADTSGGGYRYILAPFITNETVSAKVWVKTNDPGNQTGFIWVRVTWQAAGSSSVTYTNIQIANNVETILSTTFTNIKVINISNY